MMEKKARGHLLVPFEVSIDGSTSRSELKEIAEEEVLPEGIEASDIDIHDWGV